MRWLNCYRNKLLVVVFVAAIVANGGQLAIADFIICDPMPVDEAINSPGAVHPSGCDFLPNGLKLYFGQGRDPDDFPRRDVWVAERESMDAPWGQALNLGPNVNTTETRGDPAISPDDLELYFNQYTSEAGNRLMRSVRVSKDEPWGLATEFTGLGDAQSLDFAPDGLSVYFESRRSGGYGARDIWIATRPTTYDDWGEAVNLGPNVNDFAGQCHPCISNDGLALFFVNFLGRRIHMCVRATTNDDWEPAIDLGPSVNGYRPEISPNGSTLYFDCAVRSGYPELFWQVSIEPIVDFNGDEIVDLIDLVLLTDNWGTDDSLYDIGPMPWGDGIVDAYDVLVLAEYMIQDIDDLDDVNDL